MPANFTKAQATQLLTASELKLFEESRVNQLRKFSASQLDRRVARTRDLRDKARDQLQRQRVALRNKTGSKRGASGEANQQRSKDKQALLADILKRFEGQLKIARKNEKAGVLPKAIAPRKVSKRVAVSKAKAPNKDFTASRMRARNRVEEEAGDTMSARKSVVKKAAAKKASVKKTVAKKTVAKKTVAKKAPASKVGGKKAVAPRKAAAKRPANTRPGGKTSGKRTASLRALNDAGPLHEGYANVRAQNTAQERKFEAARRTAIQAHLSSRNRRSQGKRDNRGK